MMENAAGGRTNLRDCKLFEDVKRSDVVLPQGGCLEAENFDASASCRLSQYFIGLPQPQKNCLASALISLSRSRLGMCLPWLVPIAAALVAVTSLGVSTRLLYVGPG